MKLDILKRFPLLIGVLSLGVGAQEYSCTVIDHNTETPIPYATVQLAENSGVITNEEGVFTINVAQLKEVDSIYISSLGYEKQAIAWRTATDSIVRMFPKPFELKGVFLTDKQLPVEAIIDSVKAHFSTNYAPDMAQKKIFFRQSDLNALSRANIEFKKSTIEELDKNLIDSISRIIPRNSSYYREALCDYYGGYKNHKINVIKAAELYDKENDGSMDALADRLEQIFKDNVKPNSYLKIKSGIFGTKVQLDSIIESDEDAKAVKVEVTDTDTVNFHRAVKGRIYDMYEQFFFLEDTKLDVFTKDNRYVFELDDYTFIDDQAVYIIRFSPKGKKDFKGVMYVNTEDFAVMRLEYENVRPIKRFKLLGISYEESILKGKLFFRKLGNTYTPNYIELIDGRNFGIDRPLKVIEKNKFVKGRRKQNELSLGLDFKNANLTKYEFVVFETKELSASAYEGVKENKAVKATYLAKYDPNFWKGYTIVEPNAAIRSFSATE